MESGKIVMSYQKALDFIVNGVVNRYLSGSGDTRPNDGLIEMVSFIYNKPVTKIEMDIEKTWRISKRSMV